MSRDLRRAGIILALGLCALASSAPARGDERKLVASLGVKEEHNDNLFFSTGETTSSFITTVSPGLELSDRTERLDARLLAGAAGLFYSVDRELDAVNQAYRGKAAYLLTPAVRLSADAAFRRDNAIDREIETTGLFVVSRSDRQSYAAAAQVAVDEKTEAGLSGSYEKVDYDGSRGDDSETAGATLTLVHDLGQRFVETKGRAVLGHARTRFTGVLVENYTLTLGASRGVSETWSVTADVGGRYTRSAVDVVRPVFVPPASIVPVTSRETSEKFGWIANVALSYRGETGRGSLSFYRDVTAASGRQGASERTALVVDVSRRVTGELSGSVSAGYYTNRSAAGEFSIREIDERTVRVRPAVRYDVTKDIFAEAGYQYARVRFGTSGTAAAQNLVYVQVGMRYSIFE